MKEKILQILKTKNEYVSGQELCEELHVSRTAIWKVMNQLKEEGYEIEAVKNKGYHLKETPDLLTEAEIKTFLHTDFVAGNTRFYPEIDSTNEEIKRLEAKGAPDGTLAIADCQTAGKGRRGRTWVSPAGENIFMSLLLKPQMRPDRASMLTLVMGLSLTKACRDVLSEMGCEEKLQIKWPNDLVWNGKKLSGILTEMSAEMEEIHYLVVGVGVNVNGTDFAPEIAKTAASLRIAAGSPIHRAAIVGRTMDYFEKDYQLFLKTQDLTGLIDDYNALLVNKDREVRVLDPKGEYTGIARGINPQGELLVECEDGIHAVYAGEVSVRGVYGYT